MKKYPTSPSFRYRDGDGSFYKYSLEPWIPVLKAKFFFFLLRLRIRLFLVSRGFVATTNRPFSMGSSSFAIGPSSNAVGHATLILRYWDRRVGSSVVIVARVVRCGPFEERASSLSSTRDDLKTNKAVASLDLGSPIAFASRILYSSRLTSPAAVGEPVRFRACASGRTGPGVRDCDCTGPEQWRWSNFDVHRRSIEVA